MDWLYAIPEHLIHRVIATCILLYAPIMIFRRTHIPRKRMSALNLHILGKSMRTEIIIPQMTEDERRECNRFWFLRTTLPIAFFVLVLLIILWQDLLFPK